MKHIFKTIFKYKLSSTLTVLSLSVAFLGIVIITMYVSFERSFDKFHSNHDNIYQLSSDGYGSWFPTKIWKDISNEVPEVKNSVIYAEWWNNAFCKVGASKKDAVVGDGIAASADFFKMFSFPLLQGNVDEVLTQPKTLVISENLATKIFGRTNVVGENLIVRDGPYRITGVMQNMPSNTIFKADAVISFETFLQGDDWRGAQSNDNWNFQIFLQSDKGTGKEVMEAKIANVEWIKKVLEEMKKEQPQTKGFVLTPITSVHFVPDGVFAYTNSKVLDILSLLAVMLMVMGIVNFINFSTSQAPLRAKSLSVQQILGGTKWRAKMQIIGESVTLSLVAMVVAVIIHTLVYKQVQSLFNIQGLSFNGHEVYFIIFFVFALIFGMLAGLYPSRYITSPPVAQAVKGKMFFSGKGKGVRNTLITIQFTFTIALIASAITIEKQLSFWNNFDMGINKNNVLYLPTSDKLKQHQAAFGNELISKQIVGDYTYCGFRLGEVSMGWGRMVDGKKINVKSYPVDERFLKFFGLKIVDGRDFISADGDRNNLILNEKAVQEFGWDKPLEKKINTFDAQGNVIGVVKNFNFASLHEGISSMTFWLMQSDDWKSYIYLRPSSGNIEQTKKDILAIAQKFDPEYTGEVRFLDDSLNRLYNKETRVARFIEFVAVWTILLAFTGLLGLIVFISRDKVKEIGIRKVNGARISEVVKMLNKGILIWMAIAFVIATPIAYYAMNNWLQNFAYKTELSWWIFALAGFIALAIALLTVSWQSWKAATRNPVEALRYE